MLNRCHVILDVDLCTVILGIEAEIEIGSLVPGLQRNGLARHFDVKTWTKIKYKDKKF